MTLTIIPVTQENWRQVIKLQVSKKQKHFIESNATSLLEAAYDKSYSWQPFALMTDEKTVGFAMIGAYDQLQKYIWLDRFMIDQDFQSKGYGRYFLEKLLVFIKLTWSVEMVVLSTHQQNKAAISFYEQNGFVNTTRLDEENGELMMTYTYAEIKN